jgi:hypothetical protein
MAYSDGVTGNRIFEAVRKTATATKLQNAVDEQSRQTYMAITAAVAAPNGDSLRFAPLLNRFIRCPDQTDRAMRRVGSLTLSV